jgi:hypothetical protein
MRTCISFLLKVVVAYHCTGLMPAAAGEQGATSGLNPRARLVRTAAGSALLTDGSESIATTPRLESGRDTRSFTFGYLEFDWDPRDLGSLPGFDNWASTRGTPR